MDTSSAVFIPTTTKALRDGESNPGLPRSAEQDYTSSDMTGGDTHHYTITDQILIIYSHSVIIFTLPLSNHYMKLIVPAVNEHKLKK